MHRRSGGRQFGELEFLQYGIADGEAESVTLKYGCFLLWGGGLTVLFMELLLPALSEKKK